MAKKKTQTSLRESLLKSSTGNDKLIEVVLEGETFYLKKPKVSSRSKILAGVQKCKTDEEKMSFSQIQSLIAFAVDKDGEQLFSYADTSILADMEAGSTLDLLGIEALNLLNVEGMVKSSEKKA